MTDALFSTEHEVKVISIILKNPDLYYGCGIRFFMMSASAHQVIFQEIETLIEKQLVPDSQMVVASLESSGNLAKVGGKEYIEYLVNQDFNKDNLKEYCKLLVASYKGSRLLSDISSIRSTKLTLDNVDTTISNLRNSLDALSGVSVGGGTVHVGDRIKEAFEEIIARTASPGIRGHSWGINSIDMATGGKSPGDWWIISGRPSQGKTALICNSIIADGKNGVPVLFFEKEMNYQSLVERLVAVESGVPIQNIRLGVLKKDEIPLIGDAISRIRNYPLYIDTTFNSDINYLENTIYKYKATKGIEVVYIDYLQLLSERDENQTQELGRISRTCKLMANDQAVCVIGLSQLNRGVEARDNKRPLMSDLRQSGNLEEDADYVVGLYRDEYYNKETSYKNLMEFIILKARNGPVGTLTLKFDQESNKVVGR